MLKLGPKLLPSQEHVKISTKFQFECGRKNKLLNWWRENERYQKELEIYEIEKYVSEMKNTIKDTNSKSTSGEEKINEFEDIAIETMQNTTQFKMKE